MDKTFNNTIKGINNINVQSLIADQGGFSIDMQHDDNPSFYTGTDRGIYTDEQLLKDAHREANKYSSTTMDNLDWDGQPKKTPTQVEFIDAIAQLVRTEQGCLNGEYHEAACRVVAAIKNVMYSKDKSGQTNNGKEGAKFKTISPRARRLMVHHMVDKAIQDHKDAEEAEVTATYIEDNFMNVETEYLPEPISYTHSGSMVDYTWSNKVIDYIITCMDPNGTGYATHPMKFKGTYHMPKKYKRPGQIKHTSAKQSLVWLMGPRGKKGFMSDPRLTREDRNILQSFVSASWDHYKSGGSNKKFTIKVTFSCGCTRPVAFTDDDHYRKHAPKMAVDMGKFPCSYCAAP
jgi:hypothetical protein